MFKSHYTQCVVQIETILIVTYHSLGKDHKCLHLEQHCKQGFSTYYGNVHKIESCLTIEPYRRVFSFCVEIVNDKVHPHEGVFQRQILET